MRLHLTIFGLLLINVPNVYDAYKPNINTVVYVLRELTFTIPLRKLASPQPNAVP
jgi:hypothetical protein